VIGVQSKFRAHRACSGFHSLSRLCIAASSFGPARSKQSAVSGARAILFPPPSQVFRHAGVTVIADGQKAQLLRARPSTSGYGLEKHFIKSAIRRTTRMHLPLVRPPFQVALGRFWRQPGFVTWNARFAVGSARIKRSLPEISHEWTRPGWLARARWSSGFTVGRSRAWPRCVRVAARAAVARSQTTHRGLRAVAYLPVRFHAHRVRMNQQQRARQAANDQQRGDEEAVCAAGNGSFQFHRFDERSASGLAVCRGIPGNKFIPGAWMVRKIADLLSPARVFARKPQNVIVDRAGEG